jgi:hypothetical protein
MLVIVLWAYRMAYKVTTQHTPFELVYSTQPIMLAKFVILTKRVHDVPREELDKVIRVRMEDLFRLDETCWKSEENINHI